MKRLLAPLSILLETAFAILLIVLSMYLPTEEHVHQTTVKAKTATASAITQIDLLSKSIRNVRQPELVKRAEQAAKAAEGLSKALDNAVLAPADFITFMDGVQAAAEGIESAAKAIDQADVITIADSLQAFADVIDKKLIPAASNAADQIQDSSNAVSEQTRQLAKIIGDTPIDLSPLETTHKTLQSLDTTFAKLDTALNDIDLEPVKSSILQVANVLGIVAQTIANADVEIKFIGKLIPGAAEFTKSLRGVQTMLREKAHPAVSTVINEIPDIRTSVTELRSSADMARVILGKVLANRHEVEESLVRVRDQSAALAKSLPDASATMGNVFRTLADAKGLSAAVRQVGKTMRGAADSLPKTKTSLAELSQFLKTSKSALQSVVKNREEYEKLVNQPRQFCETLVKSLPETVEQLNVSLTEEACVLSNIGDLLKQSESELPGYAQNLTMLVAIIRWLTYMTSGLLLLHVLRTIAMGQAHAAA